MSKKFEDFVMNVLPWKICTYCLMIIAAGTVFQFLVRIFFP